MPGAFGHNVEHDAAWRLTELLRTSDTTAIAFQKQKKIHLLLHPASAGGLFFAIRSGVVNLCLVLPAARQIE